VTKPVQRQVNVVVMKILQQGAVLATDGYKNWTRVCGEILQRNFFTCCQPTTLAAKMAPSPIEHSTSSY
jgi:hypothetical protein